MNPKENAYYPEARQLAIFLDVDNFFPVGKDSKGLDLLMNALRPWGKIALCRAYGNSLVTQPQFYSQLLKYNFLASSDMGAYKKNGADIRITVEIMDIVHTRPGIKTFVLATGDSDFFPLVESLHLYQKTVIGVGSRKNTSPKLAASCDSFLYYEDILSSQRSSGDLNDCSIPCKTSPEQMKTVLRKRNLYPPEAKDRRKILLALEQLRKQGATENITLGNLGEKLLSLLSSESISRHAVHNFLGTLLRVGFFAPDETVTTKERKLLPLPDATRLEEAIALYALDILLQEPNLVADPHALSQAIWGDSNHVRPVQSILQERTRKPMQQEEVSHELPV